MLIKEDIEKLKNEKWVPSTKCNQYYSQSFAENDFAYLLNYSFQPPLRTHQCYSCNDFGMQDSKCPVLG